VRNDLLGRCGNDIMRGGGGGEGVGVRMVEVRGEDGASPGEARHEDFEVPEDEELDDEGVGLDPEVGRDREARVGLGGIGDGSCHRLKKRREVRMRKSGDRGTRTLNSKFIALGVMTSISCAVEALWRALAPGLANDTLPTKTLCTTVLEKKLVFFLCYPAGYVCEP
jgi:hypothetical protein